METTNKVSRRKPIRHGWALMLLLMTWVIVSSVLFQMRIGCDSVPASPVWGVIVLMTPVSLIVLFVNSYLRYIPCNVIGRYEYAYLMPDGSVHWRDCLDVTPLEEAKFIFRLAVGGWFRHHEVVGQNFALAERFGRYDGERMSVRFVDSEPLILPRSCAVQLFPHWNPYAGALMSNYLLLLQEEKGKETSLKTLRADLAKARGDREYLVGHLADIARMMHATKRFIQSKAAAGLYASILIRLSHYLAKDDPRRAEFDIPDEASVGAPSASAPA